MPVAAYNVSGEYAALKAAAERGWLDERAAVLESLTAIRRAGADMIVTYHAKEVARWLQDVSSARSEAALARAGRRRAAGRDRQAPAEPAPVAASRSSPRPFETVAREAGMTEDEVMERTRRLLDERIIREITPIFDTTALGYSSMLVAAKVDVGAPAPRRARSSTSTRACRTTTCATTTSTSGSRSRPRPTRSSAWTARSTC